MTDLELAVAAAVEAGAATMEAFRTDFAVRHKAPDQPVTAADLRADALLRERITSARPDDGWLSEETRDDRRRLDCRRVWIVDPIDGTRSFIRGRAEFTVSVGLVEDGRAILGLVYNPATGELFQASRGGGVRLGGARPADEGAVRWPSIPTGPEPADAGAEGAAAEGAAVEAGAVEGASAEGAADPGSGGPELLASRSEIACGEFEPFAADYRIRPTGSTAYKLALVADGLTGGLAGGLAGGARRVYVSRGPKSEWDVVAGALLVEEAGGVVTDMRGARLRFNRSEPRVHGIVAGPADLHGPLLERARSLRSDRLGGASGT